MPSSLPQIIIRATPAQKQAWQQAAQRDGRTLSNWLARLADTAAKKQLVKPPAH